MPACSRCLSVFRCPREQISCSICPRPSSSRLLVAANYNPYQIVPTDGVPNQTDVIYKRDFAPKLQDKGSFEELVVETNRRRFGRDGTVYPAQRYSRSLLRYGNDSLAEWFVDPTGKAILVRLAWGKLLVTSPSDHQVFAGIDHSLKVRTAYSPGVQLSAFELQADWGAGRSGSDDAGGFSTRAGRSQHASPGHFQLGSLGQCCSGTIFQEGVLCDSEDVSGRQPSTGLLIAGFLSGPAGRHRPATAPPASRGSLLPPEQVNSADLLQRADDAVEQGNLDTARRAYEQALKAGVSLRDDFKRARNLGICYLNGSQPHLPEAAAWLEAAWRLRPDDENTELLLAQALAWNRRFGPIRRPLSNPA